MYRYGIMIRLRKAYDYTQTESYKRKVLSMKRINLTVKNKKIYPTDEVVICDNSDYIIEFTFDEEWQAHNVKTARFIFNNNVVDIVFQGNTVAVPVISDTTAISVGVFSGNLHTTVPVIISCRRSILSKEGLPENPAPDVYAQIIELLNSGAFKGDNYNLTDADKTEIAQQAAASVLDENILAAIGSGVLV